MQNYQRVVPRDLFNESKLLKSLGQLVLKMHDEQTPVLITMSHTGNEFIIEFDDDGYLRVANLSFMIQFEDVEFRSLYNSKENYSLFACYDYFEYEVFTNEGEFTPEFIKFCLEI